MPVVTVEVWEGRDKESKRKLIQSVTKAVSESLGVAEEHTQVILHEVPKDNWGIRGEQASRMKF